jgi:hypothetical protein
VLVDGVVAAVVGGGTYGLQLALVDLFRATHIG